jgi:hypothetical protein
VQKWGAGRLWASGREELFAIGREGAILSRWNGRERGCLSRKKCCMAVVEVIEHDFFESL